MPVLPPTPGLGPPDGRPRLAVSVEIMRELSRYSDPQDMSEVFVRRMAELFPFDRQLTLSRRGLEHPQFRVTRFNHWPEPINPWKTPHLLPVHTGGLLAELVYSDEPRVISPLVLDPDDPASRYLDGQRSLAALPYFDQGTAHNVVVLASPSEDAFPRHQLPDLVLLSNLFGRITQSLVLSQAVREAYETVDSELRTVADIQVSLLPETTPRVPGVDLAVHYQTARRAGGDYYDFFELPGDRLGLLVADASGHGAAAAVLTAIVHAVIHSGPQPYSSPGALLSRLNSHLSRRYTRQTGSFLTAFAATLDPARGLLIYACAGHSPPRLRRAVDGVVLPLGRAQRLPVGVRTDECYPEQSTTWDPGDLLVIYTDGVTEAANDAGRLFGTGGIDAVLRNPHPTAEALVRALIGDLTAFTRGAPPADDRTVVAVRRV